VFRALVVTVKTCVLRVTTKKGRHFFQEKSASLNLPPLQKNLAGDHGATVCVIDCVLF